MNGNNITILGTPSTSDVGNHTIKFTAHDSFELGSAPYTLEVKINNPPVAPSISNISALELQTTSIIIPQFSDSENDVLSYSMKFDNGSALDSSWITFDNTTRNLTLTPPSDIQSLVFLKLIVEDIYNAPVVEVMSITTDFIPKINSLYSSGISTEFIALELSTLNINGGLFIDEDIPLSYTITFLNGTAMPTWMTLDPSTASNVPFNISGTYPNFEKKSFDFILIGEDSKGQKNSVQFHIDITSKFDFIDYAILVVCHSTCLT